MKRNVAQMKLSVKWQRTNLTCRTAKQSWLSGDIAGQERDRTASSERETALPESVLRESPEREAVRGCQENLLQERLQQMERDMVRDLQKEKTPERYRKTNTDDNG
ncbi:hypothetical protein ECZU23_53780 [Escherichia coli]|nr:hypothetical protein ECZU23_53780 [Escherichia coli]